MKTYLQIVSQEFSTFHYFWLLTTLLFFIFHKSFFKVWFPFEVSKGAFTLMSCSFLALGTRNWPLVFKSGSAPLVQWPSSPCVLCQHSCSFDWKLLWVKYKPWNMAQEGRLWWSENGYVQPGKEKKKDWGPQGIEENFVCLLIQWTTYVSHLWLENLGW